MCTCVALRRHLWKYFVTKNEIAFQRLGTVTITHANQLMKKYGVSEVPPLVWMAGKEQMASRYPYHMWDNMTGTFTGQRIDDNVLPMRCILLCRVPQVYRIATIRDQHAFAPWKLRIVGVQFIPVEVEHGKVKEDVTHLGDYLESFGGEDQVLEKLYTSCKKFCF